MMENRIKAFIAQHGLLSADTGQPVLVAVSGGADSVCLLLVLRHLGYQVEAVHCNFHLRGDESGRDEQFVADLCRRLDIPLHFTHFDTRAYAELHHVSIEMAARHLRYAYFEQLRRDVQAQAVCVAHHRDDSVETLLLNMLRGTGLRGLTGIKPRRGHIVRPLLCVCRQEIEGWLRQEGQPYVTDSSNLIPDVKRNRLRLNVIPTMVKDFPQAADGLLTTARRLHEATLVYDAAISAALARLVSADAVSISALCAEPSPESILYEWLSPAGFSSATIEAVSRALPQAQGGRHWTSATHLLIVHQGRLLLSPITAERPTLRLPEPGTYRYDGDARLHISIQDGSHVSRQPLVATLDADKVRFPLTLRPAQTGDRFQPFGMKGTKLVSDYLADRHIPLPERQRQLVLADADGRIVWLVGQRTDGRFSVNASIRRTLFANFF